MATPTYFGSVSVPTSGAIASASTTAAPFAGAFQTGPSPYASISVGDIEASRSATGGLIILGGTTERGVLDFGIANAHALTILGVGGSATGNLIAQGTIQAARSGFTVPTYLPPVYTQTGATIANTAHIVQDKVTASGASTTITLSGAAAFASATSYVVIILDESAGTYIPISSATNNSFSFASVNGRTYTFVAIGT